MKLLLRVLKKLLFLAALALAGFYALACGVLYAKQTELLYPAPRSGEKPDWPGAQWLELPGPSGSRVHAVHVPAAFGERTLVHFHGNGEELAHQARLVMQSTQAGLGVFAVEYPGYGLSRDFGPPSEQKLYAASEAALVHLRDKLGVPSSQVVLSGRSLGTGVAVELARRGFGARLILTSAYTSIPEAASRLFPILPTGLLAREKYQSLRKAPDVRIPVLLIHGTRDEIIPFDMSEQLAKAFPDATLERVEGAGHNDIFTMQVVERLVAFARAPSVAGR